MGNTFLNYYYNMPKQLGKFKLVSNLGEGATCKVKLAVDTESNQTCALKIMSGNVEEALQGEVAQELDALKQLKNHTHILQVLDTGVANYGSKGDKAYIALEIAEMGTLFDVVLETGAFPEE